MATLTTLVSFDDTDGEYPQGSLIIDASGDLYGTTYLGGADGEGTVFEIAETPTGYSTTPTTLVSFTNTDGANLQGSLIVDSSGDLYGTTANGGASIDGSVFEITDTPGGYSDVPTTLASFNNTDGETPQGSLITDSAGNLYGTASYGGAHFDGTVFEIANTTTGYNSTPVVLATFNGTDGSHPSASLLADTAGNLYGTTVDGGTDGDGTIFEIAKTTTGYNSTPIALVSFNFTDGANPEGTLIADAAGNLYGTTTHGGTGGDGTIFEIAKTATGYNNAPIVLASFDGTDGASPTGSLLMDAAGNLFGTTYYGGLYNDGTVFEIANTGRGHSNTPTDLVSFDDTDGAYPSGSLIADAAGNLYGTTSEGGAYDDQGTVFEITDSGYQAPCYCRGTLILTERGEMPVEELAIGDRVVTLSREAKPIKWIGRRSYSGRFVMGRKNILPVCIKAGALADNVPKRDLWISPNHAMYFDRADGGVLVEAKDIGNGVSIVRAESIEHVEYFHVELETHDVIVAEGALSETFIDDDSRGMFHNAHEYRRLYAEEQVAPAHYCAPRVDEGYELEAIRQRIALRAGLATEKEATSGALRGFIDRITPHLIEGWAQSVDFPEAPVCLDIYAGGRLIGQTLANRYRKDFEQAGTGSGRHSFSFSVPAGTAFVPDLVEVKRSLDKALLPVSEQVRKMDVSAAA